MKQKQNTIIKVEEASELLAFLLQHLQGKSRTSIKSLLAHRQVLVNGIIQTRHDTALKKGDTITLSAAKGNIELHHPKLKIVYEDENLIVVEKKRGLLTVAAHPGSAEMTVFSILKTYVRKQNPHNGVYVVHRLDRETSGLLVFAKTPELQEYMRTYWRELVTKRTYVAIVEGILDKKEGQIKSWFTEDKRNAMVYSSPVDDGGDLAITNYKVLSTLTPQPSTLNAKLSSFSLLELNLETGRTNQIRVHMTSIGHPVLGDRKYGHGNETSPIDRLCLHARVLEFINPVTEKKLHFETPVPKEFTKLFQHD